MSLPLRCPRFEVRVRHQETDDEAIKVHAEQIIGVLKEHQAGGSASELCRKHGISDAAFCMWRSKYGGMEVSNARRRLGLAIMVMGQL